MTTTPLISDLHTGEIVTFPRSDPDEVGTFVDLVTGCESAFSGVSDIGSFALQIGPDEMHVQIDFPGHTTPSDTESLLDDLVLAGSMSEEMITIQSGTQRTIDARFSEIVARYGEESKPREKIEFGSSKEYDIVDEPQDEPVRKVVGGSALILASVRGTTISHDNGKGNTILTESQRDDLMIAGRAFQQNTLARHGD